MDGKKVNSFLWKVAIFVVSFTVLLGLVYQRGYVAGEAAVKAQMFSAQQKAAEKIQALQHRLSEIEAEAAKRFNSNKQEQKTITKEVVRYVSSTPSLSDCALDAHGMRLWNAANAGISGGDNSAGGIDAGMSRITPID